MTSSEDILGAALAAAARGWHVFPLRPGSKIPALHGLHRCPRNGACALGHQGWEQRATTDPERIRATWTARPGRPLHNVGIAAGPSGLVVIDLDVPKPGDAPPPDWVLEAHGVTDGQDMLALLAEQANQPLPADTYTAATPSGGLHLYYQAPAETVLRNTSGERGNGLGWNIDTRAHGGQVVAAGSIVAGGQYRVVADRDPAPLPGWLVERLAPTPPPPAPPPVVLTRRSDDQRSRYLAAAIRDEVTKVINAKNNRNTALYTASVALGQLVAGRELSEDEVRRELTSAAGKHVALGVYSARQAQLTITSGLRAGANRPRQVAA
jgi:hypothetical protein